MMIIVEMTEQSFYDEHRSSVVITSACHIQCWLERNFKAYGMGLISKFEKGNLFEYMEYVYTNASYPPDPRQNATIIGIDKMAMQLMIDAEKKCRHLYMEDISYSDK